jgi:hypothetical protein
VPVLSNFQRSSTGLDTPDFTHPPAPSRQAPSREGETNTVPSPIPRTTLSAESNPGTDAMAHQNPLPRGRVKGGGRKHYRFGEYECRTGLKPFDHTPTDTTDFTHSSPRKRGSCHCSQAHRVSPTNPPFPRAPRGRGSGGGAVAVATRGDEVSIRSHTTVLPGEPGFPDPIPPPLAGGGQGVGAVAIGRRGIYPQPHHRAPRRTGFPRPIPPPLAGGGQGVGAVANRRRGIYPGHQAPARNLSS